MPVRLSVIVSFCAVLISWGAALLSPDGLSEASQMRSKRLLLVAATSRPPIALGVVLYPIPIEEELELIRQAELAETARVAEVARQEAERAEAARLAEAARVAAARTVQIPIIHVVPPLSDCHPNPYAAYIYTRESGCRTDAYNAGGCRGLGQACPGSKLPCSDTDFACQHEWFEAYALSRYGSWEAAYAAWLSKHWW